MIMSTAPLPRKEPWNNGYPTWSAEPRPETEWHRDLMFDLIDVLRRFYEGQQVYVSGNLLVFYERGNRRRRVAPDVWLARGVENVLRPNYLVWEEPRGPEFVIELTSSRTRYADTVRNFARYRDALRVREYFLFDPLDHHLRPRLQGYRLRGGRYESIRPRAGRLPSQVTGLHLEADGTQARLWNPATQSRLLTTREIIARNNALLDRLQQARNEMNVLTERIHLLQSG
jgi:Uma2 family endonuclease